MATEALNPTRPSSLRECIRYKQTACAGRGCRVPVVYALVTESGQLQKTRNDWMRLFSVKDPSLPYEVRVSCFAKDPIQLSEALHLSRDIIRLENAWENFPWPRDFHRILPLHGRRPNLTSLRAPALLGSSSVHPPQRGSNPQLPMPLPPPVGAAAATGDTNCSVNPPVSRPLKTPCELVATDRHVDIKGVVSSTNYSSLSKSFSLVAQKKQSTMDEQLLVVIDDEVVFKTGELPRVGACILLSNAHCSVGAAGAKVQAHWSTQSSISFYPMHL